MKPYGEFSERELTNILEGMTRDLESDEDSIYAREEGERDDASFLKDMFEDIFQFKFEEMFAG